MCPCGILRLPLMPMKIGWKKQFCARRHVSFLNFVDFLHSLIQGVRVCL